MCRWITRGINTFHGPAPSLPPRVPFALSELGPPRPYRRGATRQPGWFSLSKVKLLCTHLVKTVIRFKKHQFFFILPSFLSLPVSQFCFLYERD